MNAHNQNQSDVALSRVLREWTVQAQLPPRFEDSVWHRIEQAETWDPAWKILLTRLAAGLARPALATSYLAVLLLAGLLAGYWQARAATAHAAEQLSARYVQLVDPYQMPHH